jgi:hypothetical protein
MRMMAILPALWVFLASVPAQAQEWIDFTSKEDHFILSFPVQPAVQAITYESEYRIPLPGRVYRAEDARGGRYSITVVDYRNALALHVARNEACAKAGGDGDQCQDDGPEEMRGAVVYASWNFINRSNTEGAKITHFATYNSDRIDGHELHLTNTDGSRTFAVVHMHEDRLYILEATVPRGAPSPGRFQISMRFLDAQWNPVRYEWDGTRVYINGYPPPPRAR